MYVCMLYDCGLSAIFVHRIYQSQIRNHLDLCEAELFMALNTNVGIRVAKTQKALGNNSSKGKISFYLLLVPIESKDYKWKNKWSQSRVYKDHQPQEHRVKLQNFWQSMFPSHFEPFVQ